MQDVSYTWDTSKVENVYFELEGQTCLFDCLLLDRGHSFLLSDGYFRLSLNNVPLLKEGHNII